MDSLSKVLFEWISAQTWKPPTFKFNIGRGVKTPLVTMIPLPCDEDKQFMTSVTGGQTAYQFDVYDNQVYLANERADELKNQLFLNLRGSLPTYTVWGVKVSNVVGYSTERKSIFRYTFILTFRWELEY